MNLLRDGRIAVIDGMRGIAIAIVVWFHFWQISWQSAIIPVAGISLQPIAETGFVGVAIFFFISGFVLMLPYAQARLTGTPAPGLRHFAARRFLKIVPSYVLAIVVLIAAGYQTYPSVAQGAKDVVLHLLFVHDWFAATNASIDGVMWSLGDEIQFYVLFPLLAFAFVRRPLLAAVALFAIANGWRVWCMLSNHFYYEQRLAQLPGYVDFFAAGMLGAFLYAAIALRRPQLARRRWAFTALSLAGFAALVLLMNDCYAHRWDKEWPQLWSVEWRSPLALACLAAGLGALFAAPWYQRVLANPLLLFLAAISYNLYLWHQPIARVLLQHRIPPYATADPHDDHAWMLLFWAVALPIALGVSALVTYAFERPILRLGKRARTTRPTPMPIAPETLAET
ncbi:MAG TPA: acyltransferase [Candidatus Elarobacter sp.]|nr:acyltransferase [Candidatus Elarobacter sp.]